MSVNCIRCGSGRRDGVDLLCSQCRDNAWLRQLLAISYSRGLLYTDDGELQDNREQPFIDFKRDSIAELIDKMQQRGLSRFKHLPGCAFDSNRPNESTGSCVDGCPIGDFAKASVSKKAETILAAPNREG